MVRETEYLTLGGESVVVARPNWTGVGAVACLAGAYYGYRKLSSRTVKEEEKKEEKYEVTQDPLKCAPESRVPGSELFEASQERLPKCQVRMAIKKGDNEFMVIGGGIRIAEYLVAPAHNFHPINDIWIIGAKGVKVKITGDIHDIAPDVSAVKVAEWSQLGIAVARLNPIARPTTATVMSSCDFRYSTGTVAPLESMIGRLRYGATTAPGFSGAAYMSGPLCYGMHVHGGAYNGGYESLYLYCRLKHIINITSETTDMVPERRSDRTAGGGVPDEGSDTISEDEQIFEYEEVGFSAQGNRMGVARASNGRYIYAQADALERVRQLRQRVRENPEQWPSGSAWADAVELDEFEPEALVGPQGARYAGEGQPPAARGGPGQAQLNAPQASRSSNAGPQQPLTKRERLIFRCAAVSQKQLSLFLRLQESGMRLNPDMCQPIPAPRQNGNPL
nr:MAG: hypothetical protein [Hanko sobemovirus]